MKPIFTNKNSQTWVQPNGIGTPFVLYSCQAITNWARDYDDPTYVKCKSPDEYGKKVVVETIPGDANEPTFTAVAYTNRELDFLLGLKCPVDFQVHFGACSVPGDPTGYNKIRHFYRSNRTNESEDNLDFIGDEDYAGVQITTEFSCEDVVTIVKVSVVSSAGGLAETQGLNDIAFLEDSRCEGDCGQAIGAGQWGVAVADANYGVATANVWYTNDGGVTWELAATDPFADNNASISSCAILPGETAPRIVVGRGNVGTAYGARFSVSDDWGATWTEVDGGGTVGVHYINAIYKYNAGALWAVGNGGSVYHSEDRGTSWTRIAGATVGTLVELWDIDSSDGEILYVVGDGNTVIRTTDGGDSWVAVDGPAAGAQNLYTIQVHSQYRIVVGGQIDASEHVLWSTNDGGETWAALTFQGSTTASGSVRRLRSAKPARMQHIVLIHGVESVSTRYGAGTNYRFYRTLDGGATWDRLNLVTNVGLNGLYAIDVNVAWACGQAIPIAGVATIQKMTY